MKSVLIIVHLLIAAASGFSIYVLWGDLTHVQADKSVIANPKLPEIFKHQDISIASDRSLFDVVPSASTSVGRDTLMGESEMESANRKIQTFHVKGIFISGSDRFALLAPDSKPDDSESLQKVSEGLSIDEYVVSAIAPGAVRLKNSSSGESIRLKAFSRNGSTADSGSSFDGMTNPADNRRNNQP